MQWCQWGEHRQGDGACSCKNLFSIYISSPQDNCVNSMTSVAYWDSTFTVYQATGIWHRYGSTCTGGKIKNKVWILRKTKSIEFLIFFKSSWYYHRYFLTNSVKLWNIDGGEEGTERLGWKGKKIIIIIMIRAPSNFSQKTAKGFNWFSR